MKRTVVLLMVLTVLLFLTSCQKEKETDDGNDTTTVDATENALERLTDIEQFSEMEQKADKIKIEYSSSMQNYEVTVEDKDQIDNIMRLLFEIKPEKLGHELPPGYGAYKLIITQGENVFVVCDNVNVGEEFYSLSSGELSNKIHFLATGEELE